MKMLRLHKFLRVYPDLKCASLDWFLCFDIGIQKCAAKQTHKFSTSDSVYYNLGILIKGYVENLKQVSTIYPMIWNILQLFLEPLRSLI